MSTTRSLSLHLSLLATPTLSSILEALTLASVDVCMLTPTWDWGDVCKAKGALGIITHSTYFNVYAGQHRVTLLRPSFSIIHNRCRGVEQPAQIFMILNLYKMEARMEGV